ncbi:putative bifunctional diguanylate cyclase/phosphodiesterase [Methylotuvimicrobium alcaliphilum]|uniref:cyclic-guanylate-specific phosphodiesterase n=2 Tax=Methylotuvimicrobium TaxID=2822410 RepID=G4T408_META2|nr:EAL domain-containing protein [Methylotuvimicrobium alcaliphilum]CCE22703.1 Response regulator receiver modulated diguanylate cyclase/phosphodiesterase with PAS/PAC sensor(S) [Methylotuvimicrobium alcaliphilum 20Z]
MVDEPGKKLLILLVDDVPENIHVLAAALKADYRIKIAVNGPAALDLAQRSDRPELILLDVMMPGMNGIEVMRELRSRPATKDIPVIFVSADSSEQSQVAGLDLGADDYLTKPVVVPVLMARVRNILQRKCAEAQLRLAAHVFDHSGEAIMITDRNNRILQVNPAFIRLTGYAASEVRGKSPSILASGKTTPDEYRAMWHSINETGFWQGEIWDRHKDGCVYPKLLTISVVRSVSGSVDYYIASFADISAQKATEEKIRHIAHHDPLTDLPNRLYLQISLKQTMLLVRRKEEEAAVMFIDLDRFKVINDSLGHQVGDGLLIEVAHRLKESVRDSDLVVRLGGDEFVIVLTDKNAAHASAHVADKILTALSKPYLVNGINLRTTPSIGISLYPHDGETIELLMKNADTAMYHAKAVGRNNYQFFRAEMKHLTNDRLLLEHSLHEALEKGQFYLHYQPQVKSENDHVIGLEVLLRWEHPVLGNVPPDQFIPVAEEIGLIGRLGEWVLNTACSQLRDWRSQGFKDVRIAVNLSVQQLRQAHLVERVASVLRANELAGGDLELEITESAAMLNPEVAIEIFNALRNIGVELAIDDFGTGYSSLSYLKLLPIQRLKLDRTFVKDIETDPNDAAICSATIALAHALGIEVVAEGVETEAQRDYLLHREADIMQGFLFAKPMPAEAVPVFLNSPRAV